MYTQIIRYNRRFYILPVSKGFIAVEDIHVRNGKFISTDKHDVLAYRHTEKEVINSLIDGLDYQYLRTIKGYTVEQAMKVIYYGG